MKAYPRGSFSILFTFSSKNLKLIAFNFENNGDYTDHAFA